MADNMAEIVNDASKAYKQMSYKHTCKHSNTYTLAYMTSDISTNTLNRKLADWMNVSLTFVRLCCTVLTHTHTYTQIFVCLDVSSKSYRMSAIVIAFVQTVIVVIGAATAAAFFLLL